MKKLWPLFCSTILSSLAADRIESWHLDGQSNAGNDLPARLGIDTVIRNADGIRKIWTNNSYGGQSLSYWVGSDDPESLARTANYNAVFAAGGKWDLALPKQGSVRPILVWFQGESDSETYDASSTYGERLRVMLSWIREDLGRGDIRVVLCGIDYSDANLASGAFTTPSPSENNTSRVDRINLINAALLEVAQDSPFHRFIDTTDIDRPDGVHMDNAGYTIAAARIQAAVDEMP